MRKLKSVAIALFIAVLGVLVGVFVIENRQPVSLTFLGAVWPDVPAALLALGCVLLGLVLGVCMATLHRLAARVRKPGLTRTP